MDTDKWFVIKSIPIKRYCRIKGVFCQLAADNGYCQCTCCVNHIGGMMTNDCILQSEDMRME